MDKVTEERFFLRESDEGAGQSISSKEIRVLGRTGDPRVLPAGLTKSLQVSWPQTVGFGVRFAHCPQLCYRFEPRTMKHQQTLSSSGAFSPKAVGGETNP